MSRRRTWLNILLIGFVAVVVALAVSYTVLTTKWSGRAEDEIAKIRARGEPVTCEELAPDPIPDQSNAALVYQRAFMMIPSGPASDSSFVDKLTIEQERTSDPSLWKKADDALARNRALMDTVTEAVKRPECQFHRDWSKGYEVMFPEYANLREISRWEAADALVKARRGDMAASVQAVDAGIRVAESIKNEPVLIPQLVRVASLKIALGALRDSVEFGKLGEPSARQLDSTLSEVKLDEGIVHAMIGERAMGMWLFDKIAKEGPQAFEALTGGNSQFSMNNAPLYLVSRGIGRPVLNADRTYYLQYMAEQIERCKKPYYKVVGQRPKFDPDKDAPAYAPITKMLCPVFERARLASDEGMAEIAVTRAALGAFAYRDRFGAYPQTLKDLESKLKWDLPKDPFSGKALKYTKTAKGFIVYSIGSNMLDDGGEVPGTKPSDRHTGDVVWKVEN